MSNTDHSTSQNSHTHLAQFVKRMREEKGFTLKTIVERAQANGHRISVGYLSGIESGTAINPTSAKLKALAVGLDVPEKEIFEAMHGVTFDDSEEFQRSELARCYENIRELSGENRTKAEVAVEALGVYIDRLLQVQRLATKGQSKELRN